MLSFLNGKNGTVYDGGAEQILLPYKWLDTDWGKNCIKGYRRVTGRQLKSLPIYRNINPAEVIHEKEKLYYLVCPACGSENCEKLSDDKVLTIIGKKGNIYNLRQHCLEPDCDYYW